MLIKIQNEFDDKHAAPAEMVAILAFFGFGVIVLVNMFFVLGAHGKNGGFYFVCYRKAVVFKAFCCKISNI